TRTQTLTRLASLATLSHFVGEGLGVRLIRPREREREGTRCEAMGRVRGPSPAYPRSLTASLIASPANTVAETQRRARVNPAEASSRRLAAPEARATAQFTTMPPMLNAARSAPPRGHSPDRRIAAGRAV